MNVKVLLCCVLATLTSVGNGARILGIVPSVSYSHQVVFQPIWRELSLRGHQVTTITTDPIKDPKLVNLTEIDMHHLYIKDNPYILQIMNSNFIKSILVIVDVYKWLAEYLLSHEQIQSLINNENEKFDVVMVEMSILSMFAFAERFNAPLIVLTSVDASSLVLSLMGNPIHPIVYPDVLAPFEDSSSIFNRLTLYLCKLFGDFLMVFIMPSQQLLIEKYFGSHYRPIQEQINDISLLLANSDPIFHKVKPLVPTVVQFGGGSHRVAPKPLPKELKELLDAATNGFIYFSLGSNVQSKDLSEETKKVIMETFAELPYTILWKFESDDLPNKPKNLFTSKWLPQQDIFKHPNIKLFITQGGLQSMDEAIYDHIPMIGMPFFGDQSFNVNKMVKKGFGLSLNHKTLNKDEFKATILEVINNPKYRNKVKELAELASDQPMTGLEKAIWWTEYVIRHNGTKHLSSPLKDVPFYQYYLLDVAAVLLLLLIVTIGILTFTIKFIVKLLKKLVPTVKQKTN